MEGKGTEKRPEMFMIYRNVIAATIVVTVCILAGSNAMAQRHGGFSGGGFRGGGGAFGRAGFNSGGFRGGFNGHGFRGDRWASYPRPMVVSPPAVARFPSSTNLAPRFRWISATHSFTIPIRITDTIPTNIILTITDIIPTPNLFTKAVPDIPTL